MSDPQDDTDADSLEGREVDAGVCAVVVTVPERVLNELAAAGIGDGVEVPELRNVFQLPMMGPMELVVGMTITEVSFRMDAVHDGALVGTVRARGTVDVVSDPPMSILPGAAQLRGEVLVRPIVELHEDGSFVAILDLPGSELIDVVLEGIDGLSADATAQAQMSEMLFAAVGGELFDGLANNLGAIGVELGPDEGAAVAALGVAVGPALLRVDDGALTVALLRADDVEGRAPEVDATDGQIGVGLCAGAVNVMAQFALAAGLDGLTAGAAPIEVDVALTDRRVGTRIRSTRIVASPFVPDLRLGLRTTIRPRLVGDHIELSVREAWVELPRIVPDAVNRFNRWLGGAASRAPLRTRIPARTTAPVRPGSDATMDIVVERLDVTDGGVAAALRLQL